MILILLLSTVLDLFLGCAQKVPNTSQVFDPPYIAKILLFRQTPLILAIYNYLKNKAKGPD